MEALEGSWLSGVGPFVRRAEEAFAAFVGARDCVVVSNGTAALHAALAACGVGPGDEVIVPGLTFVSPAQCVARCGAIPLIADAEPEFWCIDPDEVQRLITEKTKGAIAVDVLGHPADYDRLAAVCKEHGLFLIEDAAEAHGSRYKGRLTGNFGDCATFSFFANKTLSCGEGGAVVSANPELLERVRLIKNHGMRPDRPYWHEVVGDNLRMPNLVAAVLLGQMERASELIRARKEVESFYDSVIGEYDFLSSRPVAEWAEVVPWIYTVRVLNHSPLSRDAIVAGLQERGIDARPLWTPLVDLPPYRQICDSRNIRTPQSRAILPSLFLLPTSSVMTDEELSYVGEKLREVVSSKG